MCPSIGTAAGGVRELITDGQDGLLVPPRNPAALAQAVRRIAGQPELARAPVISGPGADRGAFRRGAGRRNPDAGNRPAPRPPEEDELPVWPGSVRPEAAPKAGCPPSANAGGPCRP